MSEKLYNREIVPVIDRINALIKRGSIIEKINIYSPADTVEDTRYTIRQGDGEIVSMFHKDIKKFVYGLEQSQDNLIPQLNRIFDVLVKWNIAEENERNLFQRTFPKEFKTNFDRGTSIERVNGRIRVWGKFSHRMDNVNSAILELRCKQCRGYFDHQTLDCSGSFV